MRFFFNNNSCHPLYESYDLKISTTSILLFTMKNLESVSFTSLKCESVEMPLHTFVWHMWKRNETRKNSIKRFKYRKNKIWSVIILTPVSIIRTERFVGCSNFWEYLIFFTLYVTLHKIRYIKLNILPSSVAPWISLLCAYSWYIEIFWIW